MPIFKNSRYVKTPAYLRDGETVLRSRKRFEFSMEGAVSHRFSEGEHLDSIALQHYNDAQLWWVILDANPKYRNELYIQYGDILIIPSFEEVMKCLIV